MALHIIFESAHYAAIDARSVTEDKTIPTLEHPKPLHDALEELLKLGYRPVGFSDYCIICEKPDGPAQAA